MVIIHEGADLLCLFFFTQVEVIDALTAAPRLVILDHMTDDISIAAQQGLLRESSKIQKYCDIFLKFSDVHHGINHARALTPEDIQRIGK